MSLDKVFKPASIVVIGASRNETKRGYQVIKTLLDEGFEGDIYPVNPSEDVILGLPCFPSVEKIPHPVDLALVATPARTVPSIIEACGKKGIAGAVLLAAGFREIGEEGKQLEAEVVAAAQKHGVRLIGPNTSGMMNLRKNMNLVGIQNAPKGNIALLTQSGNMALSLITEASIKSNKGFSYYVGVGNESDIQFHEYLEFFREDENTKAILMYVEGMKNGRKFLQEAYRTTREKPVVLLESGRSSTGKKSAGSHTGAIAGMSEVAQSAFKRAGILTIKNSDELWPVVETVSSLPPLKNNSIAILADGGGHATIAADMLSDLGIELPELHEKTQAKLREILPYNASVRNPVDVAGGTDSDPTIFADCARAILRDHDIGGLLVVGLFGGYGIRFAEKLAFMEEDAAHRIGKLIKKKNKPIVVHSLYTFLKPHTHDLLRYYNVPVYDSLEIACRCMGMLGIYGKYLKSYQTKTNFVFDWGNKAQQEGQDIIETARKEGRNALLEPEAKKILQLHGAPVATERLAKTADEAWEAAKHIEGDVVLKIVSQDILHKSDAGGVRVKLQGEKQVRRAYEEIMKNAHNFDPNAKIRGILVSPMSEAGIEVIVGTKIDEQFGPVVMFGLGGILVEVMKDVSFRVLPISRHSAKRMIEEIRSVSILDGVRGQRPRDKKAIINLLMKVSEVIEAYPDIREMDLNPVIVYNEGLCIVDARIILKDPL